METKAGRSNWTNPERAMKSRFANSSADMSAKFFVMLRFLKGMAVAAAMFASAQVSHGFALLGPFEPYQVLALGYQWQSYFQGTPGGVVGYSSVGGPHNIGEEFRRNTPVMYYAFDANFLEFFGSNGVAAVDQAFVIMNSLTNISQYSPDLFEFPLQAQQINYQAQNFALTDLKSTTLHLMVQQLGLDQPDHYTWAVKNRSMGTPCPLAGQYVVIMRNFDVMPSPLQQPQSSAYVNGTLYSYGIVENCTGPLLSYAVPYAVDPLADTYTAVASEPATVFTGSGFELLGINVGSVGLHVGGFYNYLTRDDVGGLRYLLQTNNYNIEFSGQNTVQFVTNALSPTLLPTFDLGLLASLALTNTAAQLQAIFPDLIDTSEVTGFACFTNFDVSLVVTSSPFAPAGTFRTVLVTNGFTINCVPTYSHTFANVITNQFSSRSLVTFQTVTLAAPPFAPAGTPPVTNVVNRTVSTNAVSGEFYLIPTNLCAVTLLTNLLNIPQVTATTNSITVTNLIPGVTNLTGPISQSVITYFTNHLIAFLPISCPADTVALRQGIEQVRFVRRDFDSLIGTFWAPVTNDYTLVELTNNVLRSHRIRRTVTQPDFLFTADDLAPGPQVNPFPPVETVDRSPMVFRQSVSNNLAGPGTIGSPTTFTFNKVGPYNFNYNLFTLLGNNGIVFVTDQSSAISGLLWASFDGTTNEPVVYPNGTSINNLINQLLIQVQPRTLPNGANGVPYSFVYTNSVSGIVYTNTFSVTGGQSPYIWSLVGAGLPAGLSLSPSGQITGTPSGVILVPRTFDFVVRVTDAGARFVDTPLSITITP